MRTLLIAAAAVVTAGITSAAPAHATHWACMGGYVACGGGSAAPAKSSYKKTASKKKASKSYDTADSSYSGGSKKKKKVTYSSGSYSSSGGLASYYWQPQKVASGGWFNPNALTAAHKTLPFGTKVRVTNNRNGQSVVVTINDRGPYVKGRVIDLSSRAAGVIGMKGAGVVPVSIAVLGR